MLLSQSIKPISYVKAHASELVNSLNDGGTPIVITQNGEAKAVMQSIREYDELQKSLAMLKMIAMSEKSVANGDVQNAKDAFRDIWEEIDIIKKENIQCPKS